MLRERARSALRDTDLPLRSMALVGAAILTISMASFFRVPLLPDIGDELSMTASQLGLVTTVFALGRLATDLPAGHLADRFSVGATLALGGALLACGSILLASAQLPIVVVVAAGVIGVASSIANTTGMSFFSAAAPVHRRGSSMAGFSAALLGGQAIGPTVGGLLASLGTWRTAIWIAALIGAALAAALIPSTLRGSRARHPHVHATAHVDMPPMSRTQTVVLYSVPFSVFFTLGAMPQTVVPLIGAQSFSLSAATIGLALGAGGACRFLGAVIGGALSDRFSRKAALVPALAVQALGVGLLAIESSPAAWFGAIVLMSVASYGVAVGATMLGDRSAPEEVGRSLGRFRFVGDVGLVAGPLLAAWLYERFGQAASAGAVAVLLAVSAGASMLLTETRWAAPEPSGAGCE